MNGRMGKPHLAGLHLAGLRGGADGDRTHDLRDANATLSQLSYRPTKRAIIAMECPAD